MFAFLNLLYKSMTMFIDDYSTKVNAKDYLDYIEETLERWKKNKNCFKS